MMKHPAVAFTRPWTILGAAAAVVGIGLAALAGCSADTHRPPVNDPPRPPAVSGGVAAPGLDTLVAMMTGTFDSTAQAAADPDEFLEIRLVMVPIWPDRTDGSWLLVEQAAMAALERPYRQRVYRVSQVSPGTFRSDVFTLPGDPLAFAGAWRRPDVLAALTPEDLDLRDGCSIALEAMPDGTFAGGTEGTGCASSLGDAAYATSEVVIEPGLLVSWDRGWTADGEQAWGATAGGYRFVRQIAGPPR